MYNVSNMSVIDIGFMIKPNSGNLVPHIISPKEMSSPAYVFSPKYFIVHVFLCFYMIYIFLDRS